MSRVRTLVDYQSQISDFDGDGTRDLNINGSITAGGLTSPDVPKVDLTIAPEILEIQVDAPAAGQDTAWLWTWEQSTLPYARRTITNSPEVSVPLYKQGQYVVNNFAAYDIHGSMTQTHTLYFKWIDGAGTDNLISWATSTGPISDTHPDINGGNATDVQRITVNVPATVTPPTLTAPNVSYTVANNGSGAYTFSGSAAGDNPNLGPIYRGGTYTFNISASGHPMYLTTDNGTNFSAGTYFGEYTTGVTGSRTDSGTLTITVDANAPDTLYYQCGNHSSMRGAITVKDLAVETNINGNYVVYAMHTQEGHKTPIELRPIPSLVNQMCIVYDSSVNRFVPQDLATYVENTPSFENKIREVAGTAELVVEDGSAVVAKVNVYDDSTYLPLTGNNPGDQAFATDTDILYIWDGSAWQQAGAANTDDLAEGSTNLFYTDARVGTYLSAQGYDTATNIVASITDSAPATLDTLNELAAALGDDPNFATTTANNIATKAPINNPNFTGNITVGSGATARGSYSDILIAPGGDNAQIELWGANTSFAISHFDNDRLGIYSNVSSSWSESRGINIKSDGKVGIGTTSPTEQLDVAGNMAVSGTILANAINPTGFLTIAAQNSSGEGGEIQLEGSGGFGNVQIDNFDGMLRLNPSPNSNGHEIVQVTSSELQITSSSAYNTHFNYQNTGVNFITVANSGYTTFRSSSNNTNALIVEGNGTVKIPSGALRVGENSTAQAYGTSMGYMQTIQAPSGNQSYLSIARPGVSLDDNGLIIGEDNSNSYITQRNNKPLIITQNDNNAVLISSVGASGVGSGGARMYVYGGIRTTTPGGLFTDLYNGGSGFYGTGGYFGGPIFRTPNLGAGSSGEATQDIFNSYVSGHWGQGSYMRVCVFTRYYGAGYREYFIRHDRGASTISVEQRHQGGGENSPYIDVHNSTLVGSGTHSGQTVYRQTVRLRTGGAYHNCFATIEFAQVANGARVWDSASSVTNVDNTARTSGGGVHFLNFRVDNNNSEFNQRNQV